MRITTGILNMARRRAGRSSGGSSLLNHVKQKDGSNSRLNIRNAAASSRAAQTERVNYEKLEKSADALTSAASGLMTGVDGESKDVADQAAALVEQFNQTLKNLKGVSGVLNQFYRQSLKDAAESSKDALGEIGISMAADGSLKLDKEKFAGADGVQVKRLLGSGGDFTKKVGQIASRVADNAGVNAGVASNQYDVKGRVANSYLSKFNYRG